jgi:hypothetical protein
MRKNERDTFGWQLEDLDTLYYVWALLMKFLYENI